MLLFLVLLVLSAMQLAAIGRRVHYALTLATYDTPTGWRAVGRYGVLVVVSVIVLFPIYTTVIAALKPGNKVLVHPLLPDGRSRSTCSARHGPRATSGGTWSTRSSSPSIVTVAQVVTSVLAAYAFAILDFPGRNLLFAAFLATLLVPVEATLVVNRRTVDSLGWLNSYQGLTVPFLATAFGTFLIRQVFLTLPRDLRDAAAIDGVGPPRIPAPRRRAARAPDDRGDGRAGVPVDVEPVPVAAT